MNRIDIKVATAAFQGRALTPLTDAGRDFLDATFADNDEVFRTDAGDVCAEGYGPGTIVIESRDFDDVYDTGLLAGLAFNFSVRS